MMLYDYVLRRCVAWPCGVASRLRSLVSEATGSQEPDCVGSSVELSFSVQRIAHAEHAHK